MVMNNSIHMYPHIFQEVSTRMWDTSMNSVNSKGLLTAWEVHIGLPSIALCSFEV